MILSLMHLVYNVIRGFGEVLRLRNTDSGEE